MKKTCALLILLSLVLPAADVFSLGEGLEDLRVIPPAPERMGPEKMLRSHLRRLSHEKLQERLDKYETLKTAGRIKAYQLEMKEFFLEQLGPFPEKTPLRTRITGSKNYDGFKIEKIIYESVPGFPVTALLYLPKSPPPYPGVLLLCGHNASGKEAYQEVGILMARNGIACLCPDPIGQGERSQLIDAAGNPVFASPTIEHNIEGVAPILLGKNIASYMIWDGIRAIDYLLTRDEIDSNRIGCTGNSGGGNMTSYLMALDERITSAAPSCFITTTLRKNESPGPGDAEQNIHGQIAFGMDHPDYILMRAPRPTLVLSATRDYVPIEGAWEAFRQAKRIYTRLGYGERVSILEADEEHGFSPLLREGSVKWMRRWLMGIDSTDVDTATVQIPHEDTLCTPKGQVLLMPGTKTVFDLNLEYEQGLAESRKELWENTPHNELKRRIRKTAGIRELADLPLPDVAKVRSLARDGYNVEKLVLTWDGDISIPGLLYRPVNATGDQVLYVSSEGKAKAGQPGGPVEKLVREGKTVFAIDVRGVGETATTPWRYLNALEWVGPDVAEFFIAYMLDKTILGMRAEDILVSARYLASLSDPGNPSRLHLIAEGILGPPALHAAALEPGLFASLELRGALQSWADAVRTPVTRNVLVNCVHGALRSYDLPDLEKLIGEDRVLALEPRKAGEKPAYGGAIQ